MRFSFLFHTLRRGGGDDFIIVSTQFIDDICCFALSIHEISRQINDQMALPVKKQTFLDIQPILA